MKTTLCTAIFLLVFVAPADAGVTCRKSYGGHTFCSDGTTIRQSRNGSSYFTDRKGRQFQTCRYSRALDATVCEDR